ncbi:MAG TPA: riboflavin biosynthesis protein RibF [Verrucomicrobiae bacterium]|jgi:riboflavin kinase/FMN adenylyltransferase|nr:riboflavin biosynthesis protein RibF [Verrucomicrobiae bacterium]
MLILNDIAAFVPDPRKPLILAIGNFDGLHLGHQKLLDRVIKSARRQNGRAAVFTFREHPQHVLHPSSKPPLLTSPEHKIFLLSEAGVDICFLLDFTPALSRMEPEAFVRDVLVRKLGVREVYLGYNARFGKDRKGDAHLMAKLAQESGFRFGELEPVKKAGGLVSSTAIRELVREGRLAKVERKYGRPFSVFGKVVHGAGRGTKLGFPTANFEVSSEILPPFGVYPVRLREITLRFSGAGRSRAQEVRVRKGPWLKGILNYGYRPTFEQGRRAVPEVFILDFRKKIYGRSFEIAFYPRIREEKAFKGPEALKKQIATDIQKARSCFRKLSGR